MEMNFAKFSKIIDTIKEYTGCSEEDGTACALAVCKIFKDDMEVDMEDYANVLDILQIMKERM